MSFEAAVDGVMPFVLSFVCIKYLKTRMMLSAYQLMVLNFISLGFVSTCVLLPFLCLSL